MGEEVTQIRVGLREDRKKIGDSSIFNSLLQKRSKKWGGK